MARPKGSKNRNSSALPGYAAFSTQQKLLVLANLIVDRIMKDQRNNNQIYRKLMKG